MLCDDQRYNLNIEKPLLIRKLADYERLFRTSKTASLIIDSDGIPLDCNEAYFKLLGFSELSQITPFHFQLVSPVKQADGTRSSEKADENIRIAQRNGRHSFEWLHKNFNGCQFRSSVVINRLQFSGKECLCISLDDIEELRKSQEEIDSIARNSLVGLLLVKGGRKLCRCNQRAADILGYGTPEEMVGISMKDFHLTDESFNEFGKKHYYNLSNGETIQVEYEFRRKNGKPIWCTISGKALDTHRPSDLTKGVLWVFDDISTRKAMELEVLEAKNRAEEARLDAEKANTFKSDFLANMSHEIRTPINAIIGLTYLINQTDVSPLQQDYLQKVESSANSLLEIINDVLDLSKIEAGKLEIECVDFDLHSVVKNVSTLVEMKAAEKGLNLTITYDEDVPRDMYGDPLRLGQILTNLANNAVKFTENGEVEISVSRISGNRFQFEVRDTGIGIEPDQRKILFQSFSQANASTTRKYGGTGLGLAICKQLVTMMQGNIRVESEYGKGSSFIFDVVLENKVNKKEKPKDYLKQDLVFLKNELKTLSGSHILLVEDNMLNRKIVRDILSNSGIIVHDAHNGKEAVEIFRSSKGKFELVLMDIQMPVMDGYEATNLIRKIDANIPIVALTANALLSDVKLTKDAGMNEHLDKPINIAKLFSILLKYIAKKI